MLKFLQTNKISASESICSCWPSQENIKTAVHMTKSVEATRAHLQGQLRNKEAENNRLTAQLRVLTPERFYQPTFP